MLVTNKFGDHVVHQEVDAFTLCVHLRVIRRGLQMGNTQRLVQTLHDLCYELCLRLSVWLMAWKLWR